MVRDSSEHYRVGTQIWSEAETGGSSIKDLSDSSPTGTVAALCCIAQRAVQDAPAADGCPRRGADAAGFDMRINTCYTSHVNALRLPVLRLEAPAASRPGPAPWLLLAIQLPARPSNGRVKTWRRLQQTRRSGTEGVALRAALLVRRARGFRMASA